MAPKMDHATVAQRYTIYGRRRKSKFRHEYRDEPDGRRIIFNKHGFICRGHPWCAWECTTWAPKVCETCPGMWGSLLDQVRNGYFKEWPKMAKYIPDAYKPSFVRAFLEGKIKREG